MNPAAVLSRLKPDLRTLRRGVRLPFVGKKVSPEEEADAESHADYNTWGEEIAAPTKTKSKRRIPWKAIGGVSGSVAIVGGLGAWLWLNADATTARWLEQVPTVTVEVKGGAPTAPRPPADAHGDQTPGARADSPTPTVAENPGTRPAPSQPMGPVTLTPAPAAGLVEESPRGPLPKVSDDGRKPWRVYARPFPENDPRPRVAIMIGDMGMSGVTTGNALARLPPEVSLGFVPHAERLESWVERARQGGHEVLLSLPMEPLDYPRSDPGSNALLTRLTPDRNVGRLEWAMGRFLGYVGITTLNGGRFVTTPDALKPVLDVLAARGMLYLDPGLSRRPPGPPMAKVLNVPRAMVDSFIDRDLSRGAIDEQLKDLVKLAKENGAAVGVGLPYPTTIERVDMWARTLQDHGVVLAPVSAVVNRQKQLDGMQPPTLEGGVPVAPAPPVQATGGAPAGAGEQGGDHGGGGHAPAPAARH